MIVQIIKLRSKFLTTWISAKNNYIGRNFKIIILKSNPMIIHDVRKIIQSNTNNLLKSTNIINIIVK